MFYFFPLCYNFIIKNLKIYCGIFRKVYNMAEQMMLLGLPAKTWVIVGGLYLLSAFLPSIIATFLRRGKKEGEDE